MKWADKFATGVADIDEQHKSLFDWFAQLESAANDQRIMIVAYALTRLMQYTRTHFAAEERLMADCAYPRLAAHRAEHEAFRQRLQDLRTASLTQDIGSATVNLLREWLVKHITVSDMDYIPYVKGLSHTAGGPAH